MTDTVLAAGFPPATRAQWLALVEKVLKGAEFDTALRSKTYDGLTLEPLYDKAAGGAPLARSQRRGPWRVVQRVDHPDPAEANALALTDLEGGADGLALAFAGAPAARGYGLGIETVDDLDRTLAGVKLDLVHLRVETAPFTGRRIAAAIAALADRRGHAAGDLAIDFGLDPVGDMARTGRRPAPWETVAADVAETASALAGLGFRRSLLRVDARPVHEAGGSQAQELAFAVATGIAYLRALEAHRFTLEAARDAISFLLVADADQFLTLAKFRAMRRLWARVEDACGLPPQPIGLEAETAWRMTSKRDPFVNMLRGTIAAFAAGGGGADGVTVLPFTAALGLPDAFARRMARNTQLVLIEEAHLGRVADPAAGAGSFEALTSALAERAWTILQRIESMGGVVTCLSEGGFQADIAKVRAEHDVSIRHRIDALTGTSEFPNLREAPIAVLTPPPPTSACPSTSGHAAESFEPTMEALRRGARLGDVQPHVGNAHDAVEPLPSIRDAEPFERLRDMSDERLAKTGFRPRVFLANLGSGAAFTTRARFAQNFFEAGGVKALTNDGFDTCEAVTEAFKQSGARLACVCSSDELYQTSAPAIVEALQSAGAAAIYIAGRPQNLHESLRNAQRIRYVFAGCDAPSLLEEALKWA